MNKFTPSQIAEFTGFAPELQRNWRSRGFLDLYGQDNNAGRWLYGIADLTGFWLAEVLSGEGKGMDRQKALTLGRALAHAVLLRIEVGTDSEILESDAFGRYSVSFWRGIIQTDQVEVLGGWSLKHIKSLGELDEYTFHRADVLDMQALANDAPPWLERLAKHEMHMSRFYAENSGE